MIRSGFTITSGSTGYGTLKVKGTITVGTATFEVTNTYTTGLADNYVSVVTTIKNIGASNVSNLRFWIGTRDDYVGGTDVPTKTRGNIVNGVFTPLTVTSDRAAALMIKTADETYTRAINPLEKYIAKNPTDKDVLTILYQLNRSIGNTEKAKEYKAKIDALK